MTEGRRVRVAAVADVHFDSMHTGALPEIFTELDQQADVLALCGDLTTHGKPEQIDGFIGELKGVDLPIVAVLGNHDHESDCAEVLAERLRDRGIHVLDGDSVVIEGIGFAGVKGFAGGFGRGALAPFGETLMKEFAKHAIDEAIKLENALRELDTTTRVALLHYSPIEATVHGEPEVIWPFLGSSRLVQPLDTIGADVVFHGHAHIGAPEGATPGGIPVYNVALPVLRELNMSVRIWEAAAPDRRRARDQAESTATR